MREYSVYKNLRGYAGLPGIDAVTDYQAAIRNAEALVNEWEKEVKEAKYAYEKSLEQEEERKRRERAASDNASDNGGGGNASSGNMTGGDY